MKNSEKIQLAEQVVAHARTLGFEHSHLEFLDEEEGCYYDTIEELTKSYGAGEQVRASVAVVLDEDLSFSLAEDPDSETTSIEFE